jgi:2-dehydro-3-deoxyphosphogluconate aldolase/(4S)-4-hydroxy-2-oxoglutarate aldolase
MVKVFPANVFGPSYFRDLRGPFNSVKLMAVGGVNTENIKTYMNSGASAVAIGGSIFSKQRLESGDYSSIEKDLKKLVSAL